MQSRSYAFGRRNEKACLPKQPWGERLLRSLRRASDKSPGGLAADPSKRYAVVEARSVNRQIWVERSVSERRNGAIQARQLEGLRSSGCLFGMHAFSEFLDRFVAEGRQVVGI